MLINDLKKMASGKSIAAVLFATFVFQQPAQAAVTPCDEVASHLGGKFESCDAPTLKADLQRYMDLALDNITLTASAGRVEALNQHYLETIGSE